MSFLTSVFLSLTVRAQLVVQVLVRLIPSMINVALASCALSLFFCVVGVHLFAGKFYYCYNQTSQEILLPDVVESKTECLSLMMENNTEIQWKNMVFHYDNVIWGYISLLLLVSVSTACTQEVIIHMFRTL